MTLSPTVICERRQHFMTEVAPPFPWVPSTRCWRIAILACRRLAPPAKGGGVGNSAAWCKVLLSNRSGRGRSTCSSGKSVLVACTLVQSIQHSRAEVRATLFRSIEKVPKASPMYHIICPAHTARARCFVPAFHQSPRRHKELFGLGLRRIQCCDRFGVLAVLHCGARFPNRHGGFPVLTAAALRHVVRPFDAAPPAHADAD